MASKYSLLQTVYGRAIRNNCSNELVYEYNNLEKYNNLRKRVMSNLRQAEKSDCMKSLGLTKTKYGWE